MWSSSAAYMTICKRDVEPSELRSRLDVLLQRVNRQLAEQYDAAITVIDRCQRGENAVAVTVLLAGGAREERAGRLAAARAWYSVALGIAEGLSDRHPEIATLLALGGIDRRGGAFAAAARTYQRCLALAEAEGDVAGALGATLSLGEIAITLGNTAGARAWCTRGLRQAQGADLRVMIGRVHRLFAAVALREGDLREAQEALLAARACFRADEDAADLARVLLTEGTLHEALDDRAAAAADYREALMWTLLDASVPELELAIRLGLARLHTRGDRLLEAEEEMRRAEERALEEGLSSWLVRIYVRMGETRGRARDEDGFVFFEQAIELCRSLECTSLLEAEVYRAYGDFREALGDLETAGACFERAERILQPLGTAVDPALLAVSALL
jgi:tetratricopeptide (TPR) repeat protein